MDSNQIFLERGQIKNMKNSSNSEIGKDFSFNLVTTNEIKQLIQSLNAKKVSISPRIGPVLSMSSLNCSKIEDRNVIKISR